ncbi:MAG TPA: 50S ribosomal protein L10 [Dehalococcoidia bacterium]|nr:50S ribosomal protein L10 [Dehalococcoidia bacterium]
MPTARKEQQVEELHDLVSRATIAISTGYRGLSVGEMMTLRRRMREAGVEVRVVKNTLLKLAAERAGQPKFAELGIGPTAILFGYGDVAAPAKAVQEYVRTARNALTVNSAYMDGQVLNASELGDIANLPSREQMLANFMGGLRSPVAAFASLLQGTIQQFAGLVDARANQLEGSAA